MGSELDLDALLAIVRQRTPWKAIIRNDDDDDFYYVSSDGCLLGTFETKEEAESLVAAVNNFEPLAERCKRAEDQRDELVLSLQRIEREYYGTGAEIIAINALRSVKGGADGKA